MPITLYELHGIGGAYDLFLPTYQETLLPLRQELLLQYTVLEGEHVGHAVYQGSFVTLSARGGEVRADAAVAPWSNIRVQLLSRAGEGSPGELYAKVLRHLPEGAGFYVHFTSIPPEVAAFFQRLLA